QLLKRPVALRFTPTARPLFKWNQQAVTLNTNVCGHFPALPEHLKRIAPLVATDCRLKRCSRTIELATQCRRTFAAVNLTHQRRILRQSNDSRVEHHIWRLTLNVMADPRPESDASPGGYHRILRPSA